MTCIGWDLLVVINIHGVGLADSDMHRVGLAGSDQHSWGGAG